MINRIEYISIGILLLGLSSAAFSGSITNTTVKGIYCGYYNGANMCSIYFNGSTSGGPGCATQTTRMQIQPTDAVGRSILALAMHAHALGKRVNASGKGTCNVWKDTEDMNVLHITE